MSKINVGKLFGRNIYIGDPKQLRNGEYMIKLEGKKPADMINYLRYYGPHFSKKLCNFAASLMTKEDDKPITPATKEDVRNLLLKYDVKLKYDQLYDSTYVLDMVRADFYGDSIEDELHTARYIKNVIDDPDAPDGLVFNRWYSDMCYKGIAIDWSEMI